MREEIFFRGVVEAKAGEENQNSPSTGYSLFPTPSQKQKGSPEEPPLAKSDVPHPCHSPTVTWVG
jgi:hypothetical protein